MSHYAETETQFKDEAVLIECLKEMPNKIRRNWTDKDILVCEEATNLYGYRGDMRSQKANIIIRRENVGGSSNDLGFVKNIDGTYSAIISDFDKGFHNTQWMTNLTRLYAEKKTEKELIRKNMTYKKYVLQDKTVRFEIQAKKTY